MAIRENKTRGIYIEGVKEPYVTSSEDVLWHLEEGGHNRATSSTRMNATSSRSHAVFIFKVIVENKVTHSKKMSKLMMVDLAGSEKVRKTQAHGQRLEEAKGINQSLSTLGRVIQGLTTGKGHIAYRDSKLTRLLSDSLGGNSKTCIIVTCSPCEYNVEETISTLRFGVNCKKVKNKPKVNQERSIAEYKMLLKRAKDTEEELLAKNKVLECKVEALSKALEEAGGSVEDAMAEAEREHRELFEQDERKEESDSYHERYSDDSDRGSPRHSRRRQKKPDVVFHTSGGGGAEVLKEQLAEVEELLAKCKEERNRYKDDAKNATLELVETERTVQELTLERESIIKQKKQAEETVKKMAGQIGEYRLYKTKLDFVTNDHEIQIQRKNEEMERLKQEIEDLSAQAEENERSGSSRRGDSHRDKKSELKAMAEIATTSTRSSRGGDRELRIERYARLLDEKEALSNRLKDIEKENKRNKKQIQMMEQRERYNDALRRNWNNQLAQMEQAVLLANQIHNRDRQQFQLELEDHTQENIRLKKFLRVLSSRQKTNRGNVARPVRSGSSSRKSNRSRRKREKRQSINFHSNRRKEPRQYQTPGGDEEDRYKEMETRGYRE